MQNQNYQAIITVDASPKAAFKAITEVNKWWTENLEGASARLNDVFTVDFGKGTFVTCKLTKVDADKKIVWLVTDCDLTWLKDKKEWTGTSMIFELSGEDHATTLHFTHVGIVPEVECYNDCVKGWDQYIKGSLFKLITEGAGAPQRKMQVA